MDVNGHILFASINWAAGHISVETLKRGKYQFKHKEYIFIITTRVLLVIREGRLIPLSIMSWSIQGAACGIRIYFLKGVTYLHVVRQAD